MALFLLSSLEETAPRLPTFLLMNLLSLAGDVALQQLVHLEQAVSGELGRRRVLREEQEHRAKEPKEKVREWPGALPSFHALSSGHTFPGTSASVLL